MTSTFLQDELLGKKYSPDQFARLRVGEIAAAAPSCYAEGDHYVIRVPRKIIAKAVGPEGPNKFGAFEVSLIPTYEVRSFTVHLSNGQWQFPNSSEDGITVVGLGTALKIYQDQIAKDCGPTRQKNHCRSLHSDSLKKLQKIKPEVL